MARGNLMLPGALGLLFCVAFLVFAAVFQYDNLYPSYEASILLAYYVVFVIGAIVSAIVFILGFFGRNA